MSKSLYNNFEFSSLFKEDTTATQGLGCNTTWCKFLKIPLM